MNKKIWSASKRDPCAVGVRSLRVDLAWLGLAAVCGHYQSLTNVAARPKHRVRTKTSMIVIEKGEMINQITSEVGFTKENKDDSFTF